MELTQPQFWRAVEREIISGKKMTIASYIIAAHLFNRYYSKDTYYYLHLSIYNSSFKFL